MNFIITSIKYPFAIDRDLGTLREEKIFSEHVKQMILQLLFTSPGERINRPDFGCGLRRMVFAPINVTSRRLRPLRPLTVRLGVCLRPHRRFAPDAGSPVPAPVRARA